LYAKLFTSITESSLWSEPKEVRLLFVTMLAKADQDGFVEASIPGLARVANLTIGETEASLKVLLSPDPYSKNPANEGRRIAEIPGGFLLLNYEDYRARRSTEERREYMRQYMQEYRTKKPSRKHSVNSGKQNVNSVSRGKPPLAHTEADTEADTDTEKFSHTHSQRQNQKLEIPLDLAMPFSRWAEWIFATTGQAIPNIQAETLLMDLGRRGADKATRDVDFSINKGAKSILDSDNDFQKRQSATATYSKPVRKRNYE
jgi:hypothetical protein